jgi:hypothetical protein
VSSNINVDKSLLGRYGLFSAGVLGNNNVNASNVQVPMFLGSTTLPAANVVPANLSSLSNGTPGSIVTNGTYTGQGISAAPFDSGPLFFQRNTGWAKWGVQVRPDIPGNGGAIQGLSATLYGTWDWDTATGALTTYSSTTGLRTAGNENWVQVGTASQQSGDGMYNNPMTAWGQGFSFNNPFLALRVLVTNLTGGSVLFAFTVVP